MKKRQGAVTSITAEAFAVALRTRFYATRETAALAEGQREWSAYMFSQLAEVAKDKGLWWAGSAPGLPPRPNPAEGEIREYLWDFTMFDRTEKAVWNLPRVVIEHENLNTLDAFRFDHWKTLLAAAPLRVAIG